MMSMWLPVSWTYAKSEVVYQMESGFKLEKEAATKLVQALSMKPKQRVDYYADIYDGTQFLLIPSAEHYKFRMKAETNRWVVQANTKSSLVAKTCSEGWSFFVKEKQVGELSLKATPGLKFEKLVFDQLDLLATSDTATVKKSLQEFQGFLLSLGVPLMEDLLKVTQGKKWTFVASHLSKKTKWKALLPENPHIEVSVTMGQDFVGSTYIQDRYEIEFQVSEKGLLSAEEFSDEICQFMRDQGIRAEDLDPVEVDIQKETLSRLAKHPGLVPY